MITREVCVTHNWGEGVARKPPRLPDFKSPEPPYPWPGEVGRLPPSAGRKLLGGGVDLGLH